MQLQKAVLHLLFIVCGDKSAFALAAGYQVFCGQFINGFAHCALTDLEAASQLDFAGDELARFPLSRLQALQNQAFDLLVQGTEGGRSHHRAVVARRGWGVGGKGAVLGGMFKTGAAFSDCYGRRLKKHGVPCHLSYLI